MSQLEATTLTSRTGGGNAQKEHSGRGVQGAAAPSLFDRLPDELILHIFRLLHSSYSAVDLPGLSSIRIDLRLYRLGYSVWLRFVYTRSEFALNRLLHHPRKRAQLRYLTYAPIRLTHAPTRTQPEIPCIFNFPLIGHATNLIRLTITSAWEDNILPSTFTDGLRSLQNLQTLEFIMDYAFDLVDRSFTVGSDIPSLRTLRTEVATSAIYQLLRAPCPNLRHLHAWLEPSSNLADVLPWKSLHNFTIRFSNGDKAGRPVRQFLSSLRQALSPMVLGEARPTLPLEKLYMEDKMFREASLHPQNIAKGESHELFVLMHHMQIRTLGLSTGPALAILPDYVRVPSVTSLRLDTEELRLYQTDTFGSLLTLLTAFPSLTHLELVRARFLPSDDSQETRLRQTLDPSSLTFTLRYPTLPALLLYLKHTSVFAFDWKPASTDEYRWTRSHATEEFLVDRYTAY